MKTELSRLVRTLALAAALGPGAAPAALINGGFETGTLAGWTPSLGQPGTATVVASRSTTYVAPATYLPVEGSYFLAITGGPGGVWQTVTQTVSLAAGDLVSGWAAFDWGDYLPYGDGARVRILDGSGSGVAMPFYLDGTLTPGTLKGDGEADAGYNGPWTAWSFTVATAGTYTIEFGVRNVLDAGGPDPTNGYFDATTITSVAVPEPGSVALIGLSLALLAALGRLAGRPPQLARRVVAHRR